MKPPREAAGEAVALGAGAEFDAIRTLLGRWGTRAVGVGDDAAVLSVPRGDRVVASVDTAIEGRHFRAEWLTPREIGYRAVTAALSDLAAMAAGPLGILVSIVLSKRWHAELAGIADGIGDAADASASRIVGGNIAAADLLSITTTVLGSAYSVLRRDGLHEGDNIYVTGRLGGPGAALRAWSAGREPEAQHRARFAGPRARLDEARWLAERGATAAIDISDGLAADLGHLAAASCAHVEVDLARLPLVEGVTDLDAAASGEEFELVVGSPQRLDVAEFEARFALPLTLVGHVRAGDAGVTLHRDGERVAPPSGYDHLSP